MDLQSEIEARRARLAELKKKRNVPPTYETIVTELFAHTPVPSVSRATQSVIPETKQSANYVDAEVVGDLPQNESPKKNLADDREWILRPASPSQVLYKFLDDAWRTVERVSLNRGSPNFTELPHSSAKKEDITDLKQVCSFSGQAVDCDWSPQFPELVAVTSGAEIAIWSLDEPNSPEYRLHAPTSGLCAVRFVPGQPHLIVACSSTGQIFAWDLRDGRYGTLPAVRSLRSGYAIAGLSVATAGQVVTVTDDGLVCSWIADRLVRPQQELRISSTAVPRCVAVDAQGSHAYVGALDGSLTTLRLIPSLGAEPGISSTISTAHDGPITSLSLRAPPAGSGCAPYLMTCGLDWTLRLWRLDAEGHEPQIVEKIQMRDAFPSALAWRPGHPSQFAVVSDRWLQVWDLLQDTKNPLYADPHPATNVKWLVNIAAVSPEGLRVLEVPKADASLPDWQAFDAKYKINLA